MLLGLAGCDDVSQPPQLPPQPPPDPLYEECVSFVPVDAGDRNQPVITLKGSRVVILPLGTAYVDVGATAADPREGDISSRIVVTGLAGVNTNTVGDYMVRYNVANATNLRAVEAVRLVRVHGDAFAAQTARDIGTTGAHMGYYEHLPAGYGEDPARAYPLIVFQHGWSQARFLDDHTVQAPLSEIEAHNLSGLIHEGRWDNSLPFIVLSPQSCVDALIPTTTAGRMKRFIDYAINTYQVDTSRIYMSGHSQGSGDTWDYVLNYPRQLAAVVPISGGYGSSAGCLLKDTPAWAFNGELDTTVAYYNQVETVRSINACNPAERARVTVLPGLHHNDLQQPIFTLTALGQGLPAYDPYDESIYAWLLRHRREPPALAVTPESVEAGRTAMLRWAVTGAASCRASGDWTGDRPARGAESIRPDAPGSYNYVLSCAGPAGEMATAASLEVRAAAPPGRIPPE